MNESEIHNKIFSSNEYHNCFKGIYNIDFYTLSDGEIHSYQKQIKNLKTIMI